MIVLHLLNIILIIGRGVSVLPQARELRPGGGLGAVGILYSARIAEW